MGTREPTPRHAKTTPKTATISIAALLAFSLVSAFLHIFRILPEDAIYQLSQIAYVVVPIGAGAIVYSGARTLEGRARLAWRIIAAGILSWGLGEAIWVFYDYVLKVEVPYPGWADVFYVAGYPLMFAGVLMLPHIKPRRLERLRLFLDALAGTIALSAVLWVTYLGDQFYLDQEVGVLERWINVLYPFGDAFLLIGLMILTVRRSRYRFDPRLIALAGGMILTAVADVLYIQNYETYVSAGPLDSVWLFGYAAFILAGGLVCRPVRPIDVVDRTTRVWQLATPYAAVAVLFALTLWDIAGDVSVLEISSGLVGIIVIGRQAVAIRENREVVETQRNDLIASISHELRTPLTGVTGFTALLKSDWENLEPAERAEMISIVDGQAQHVNRIVTDLIGIARDTLHSTDLDLENVDVDLLVRDATAMVPELSDGRTTLDIAIEPGLTINADRGRIVQTVMNLLTNAVRYGETAVTLSASSARGGASFEIQDDGPGVPKRYEEAIWDRFERGAHRLDSRVPGSGIGLSIARSLVEAHGGTIEYRQSETLGGAAFRFWLPGTRSDSRLRPGVRTEVGV